MYGNTRLQTNLFMANMTALEILHEIKKEAEVCKTNVFEGQCVCCAKYQAKIQKLIDDAIKNYIDPFETRE